MNKKISLSIIIPFYNVENYISDCVKSIVNHSIKGCEIIFINDCSNDNSLQVLHNAIDQSKAHQDHDVIIINNPQRLGSAESRNIGLNHASKDFIAWYDADDTVDSDYYLNLYRSISYSDADLSYTDYFEIYSDSSVLISNGGIKSNIDFVHKIMLEQLKSPLWNKVFRRSIIQDKQLQFIKGQDMAEDRGFCIKYLSCCDEIRYVANTYYYYRRDNQDSLTNNSNLFTGHQYIVNAISAVEFLDRNKFIPEKITDYKLIAKKNLLMSYDVKRYREWKNIFKEVNSYVWNTIGLRKRFKLIGSLINFNLWPVLFLVSRLKG